MTFSLFDTLKRWLTGRPAAGTSPFPAGRGPARIVLMRHAEKTGDKSDPHLSSAGSARAEALTSYIPQTFGTPDFLFAARSSKSSRRPAETLEPLAAAIGRKISETHDDEEFDALVAELGDDPRYAGSFCVISWRHSDIPALAAALGAPDGSYPSPWPRDLYDRILDFTFSPAGPVTVRQIDKPF